MALTAFALTSSAAPSYELSAELDGRYGLHNWRTNSVALDAVAGSARLTIPDVAGDRFVFFALIEAVETFDDVMVHELYARVKGPMGRWNLSMGRFNVPYGLLTSFSSSRYLYETVEDRTVGVEADNGVHVSGVLGRVDYALAGTQGLGHHRAPEFPGHGLASGRVGLTLGEYDQVRVGFSAAHGYTEYVHHKGHVVRRSVGGIDATIEPGRLTMRGEISAGRVDWKPMLSGFAVADFALHRLLELTVAGSGWSNGDDSEAQVFAGAAFKHRWITIRGGYEYALEHEGEHHMVSLQLYRRFTLAR